MAQLGHARWLQRWARTSCGPHALRTDLGRIIGQNIMHPTISSPCGISTRALKRSLSSFVRRDRLRSLTKQYPKFLHSSGSSFHLKGHRKREDPAADYAEGRKVTILGLISNVALSVGYEKLLITVIRLKIVFPVVKCCRCTFPVLPRVSRLHFLPTVFSIIHH
jgi:hypothetical protein